jgi:hypothetical protein
MDILTKKERVAIDYLKGHGGYFKSKGAGAIIMEKTLGIPIKLLDNAGEGGPWGMAILAAYRHIRLTSDIRLDEFMRQVFKGD